MFTLKLSIITVYNLFYIIIIQLELQLECNSCELFRSRIDYYILLEQNLFNGFKNELRKFFD